MIVRARSASSTEWPTARMEEVAGRAAAGAARIAMLRGADGGAFGKKDETAATLILMPAAIALRRPVAGFRASFTNAFFR